MIYNKFLDYEQYKNASFQDQGIHFVRNTDDFKWFVDLFILWIAYGWGCCVMFDCIAGCVNMDGVCVQANQ